MSFLIDYIYFLNLLLHSNTGPTHEKLFFFFFLRKCLLFQCDPDMCLCLLLMGTCVTGFKTVISQTENFPGIIIRNLIIKLHYVKVYIPIRQQIKYALLMFKLDLFFLLRKRKYCTDDCCWKVDFYVSTFIFFLNRKKTIHNKILLYMYTLQVIMS